MYMNRSMFVFSIYRIPLVLLVLLVCAAADTSSDVSDSSLLSMVPDCAKDCVESFIKSEYTSTQCTSPSNTKCLCRTKTPSGFTLGEAALSCVLSLCSKTVISDSDAYQICDSVSSAIPKTHETITATIFSRMRTSTAKEATKTTDARSSTSITTTTDRTTTADATRTTTTRATATTTKTTTSSMSTSGGTSTTSLTTTLSTSTTSSRTSKTTLSHSSISSSQVAPTSTDKDAFASSASSGDTNKQGDNSISPAAVIGISVGSGVAGSFIVVVAVIFCCKRWRKKRRDQDQPDRDSFEIGGHMDPPVGFSDPPHPSPAPDMHSRSIYYNQMNGDQPPRHGNFRPMATLNDQVPYPGSIRDGHRAKRPGEERIGFAISSDTDWQTSPHAQSSQHSLVRLLPDERATLFPRPLNWGQRPRSERTIFEVNENQQIHNRSTGAMMQPETGESGLAPAFSPNSNRKANLPNPQAPENTYNDLSQRPPIPKNPPMVAQPRVFQPHDIKSVDIIKSSHTSKVATPHRYYPEILQPRPLPQHEALGKSLNPSGPVHHANKWTSIRNSRASTILTPARQGDDLFLRVE